MERFYRRKKACGKSKQQIVSEAQQVWKETYSTDDKALLKFEELLSGEEEITSLRSEETKEQNTGNRKPFVISKQKSAEIASSTNLSASNETVVVLPQFQDKGDQQFISHVPMRSRNCQESFDPASRSSYLKGHEQMQVAKFFTEMCPELVTDDVLNNESFIAIVAPLSLDYFYFKDIQAEYYANVTRHTRKTKLKEKLEEVDKMIKELKETMQEAARISIDPKQEPVHWRFLVLRSRSY